MAATVHIVQPGVPQSMQPPIAAPPPQPPRNLPAMKGLAITQLVLGVLTVIFGIAAAARLYDINWTANAGGGIWAGIWIAVTGIIGVVYSRKWESTALNGVYMTFSIISTVCSFMAGLFFIVAVAFYGNLTGCYKHVDRHWWGGVISVRYDCGAKSAGLGLNVPLMLMMATEFFVSIVAAAFCCQNGCNGTRRTVIVAPVQQGQVMMVQNPYPPQQYQQQYPGQVVPQYGVAPQYAVQVPQYSTQAAAPGYTQPGYQPPQGWGNAATTTTTTTTHVGKPPAYQQ